MFKKTKPLEQVGDESPFSEPVLPDTPRKLVQDAYVTLKSTGFIHIQVANHAPPARDALYKHDCNSSISDYHPHQENDQSYGLSIP